MAINSIFGEYNRLSRMYISDHTIFFAHVRNVLGYGLREVMSIIAQLDKDTETKHILNKATLLILSSLFILETTNEVVSVVGRKCNHLY